MNKLYVHLENCYGIGLLQKTFDFTISNTFLLYAPNGTMKTSLTKSFTDYSLGISLGDKIYPERMTICEISIDDVRIDSSQLLVINAESTNIESEKKISTFIASKELKDSYDAIYLELDKRKSDLIKKLKIVSRSNDCEGEFVNAFKVSDSDDFFSILELASELLQQNENAFDFKYNEVFDKKESVKKFLDKNKDVVDTYIDHYNKLIEGSSFFKKSSNTFGTQQATELLKSTEDNSYFEAGHTMIIDGRKVISSVTELREIYEDEIAKILEDKDLKKSFEQVDKAMNANSDIRSFKKIVENDNSLLIKLSNYSEFKKEVWISYLSQISLDVMSLTTYFKEQKVKIYEIIELSKVELPLWRAIVNKFNDRFFVPFKVNIANQKDVILRKETANFQFEYNDGGTPVTIDSKERLLQILSKGEQRAYYILQFLFETESRKRDGKKHLLIFDDIADSFDYKNKFAIIQYLKEIHNSDNFKSIILTHNFHFYRTICSRLNLPINSVFFNNKTDQREISFYKGEYKKDVFKYFINQVDKQRIFVSLIPFIRNLIEYTCEENSPEYLKLTSALHIRHDSSTINAGDIFQIYKELIKSLQTKTIPFSTKNIIDLILETANDINSDVNLNEIFLQNKIVLSIALRILAEKFLITKLTGFDVNSITGNQTMVLFEEYKKNYPNSNEEFVIDKVILMTPENVHLDAFMFEPLIDMSVHHLKKLYNEILSL